MGGRVFEMNMSETRDRKLFWKPLCRHQRESDFVLPGDENRASYSSDEKQ